MPGINVRRGDGFMRNSSGTTIVELMIASLIMTIMAGAFLSILLVTYKADTRSTSITDTTSAVRQIKERLGLDVRQGRTLGDVYGTGFFDPPGGGPGAMWVPAGTDSFPGAQNPVYGAGQAPPQGWPASWPGGGVNNPYRLGPTCLIVQIPIGNNHNDSGGLHQLSTDPNLTGWPTAIFPNTATYTAEQRAQGPGNPAVTVPYDNVETHVYMVLPDAQELGTYKLEWCTFPGYPVPGYLPAAHAKSPQVLLKGIVGPLDANGDLRIFQFVDKTDGALHDAIAPSPSYVSNYTGIIVNLEVRGRSDRYGVRGQNIGFKTEVFLRNNAIATVNGG
jgi:hypothetical protein